MRYSAFLITILCQFISVVALAQTTAKEYYEAGLKFKEQKQLDQAIVQFREAYRLDTTLIEALYETGWCQLEAKNYRRGVVTMKQVIKKWPTSAKAFFELGFGYHSLNNFDSSFINYQKTLLLDSGYYAVYKQLAYLHNLHQKYKEAVVYFNEYEKRVGGNITDFYYWYIKGIAYYHTGNSDDAEKYFRHSLRLNPEYLNAYNDLGFLYEETGAFEKAIELYKQAVNYFPKNESFSVLIGNVYRDLIGSRDTAMIWYTKALVLNSENPYANFGMGYCYNSQEQSVSAIPYLEKAINILPDYTDAHVDLGYSYFKTDRHQEALEHLDKAIKLNPQSFLAHYYMGLIYVKEKNKEKALLKVKHLQVINEQLSMTLQQQINEELE